MSDTHALKEDLEAARRELIAINSKLRLATDSVERRKQKARKERTQQEIFLLRSKLRAARGKTENDAQADSGTGAMPDFVVIGAQKSGTTSLYRLLAQHPLVRRAATKEIHFFDHAFDKSVEWYRSHFPAPTGGKCGRQTITGEATPYYLFHPLVPERMARVIPQARLIAILRDPVDRAYSHYHHQVRTGTETLTFAEALDAEEMRLDKNWKEKPKNYPSENHQRFSYLSRGIYADQLARWLRFFQHEQLLVLKSEDFFARPGASMKRVLDFLDLPDRAPGPWKPSNKAGYPPMSPSTRRRLEEYFEPHNKRLYDLLGTDFGW